MIPVTFSHFLPVCGLLLAMLVCTGASTGVPAAPAWGPEASFASVYQSMKFSRAAHQALLTNIEDDDEHQTHIDCSSLTLVGCVDTNLAIECNPMGPSMLPYFCPLPKDAFRFWTGNILGYWNFTYVQKVSDELHGALLLWQSDDMFYWETTESDPAQRTPVATLSPYDNGSAVYFFGFNRTSGDTSLPAPVVPVYPPLPEGVQPPENLREMRPALHRLKKN